MRNDNPQDQTFTQQGFAGGVDLRSQETEVSRDRLRKALNVDISRAGEVKRRRGYTRIVAGDCHSLWTNPQINYGLIVRDGNLTRIALPDFDLTTIRVGVGNAPMTYAYFNGDIYYSNGSQNGRLINGLTDDVWEIPQPSALTLSATANGGLDEGEYLVTASYVRSTGEEGGAPLSYIVDVPDSGGIQLSNIEYQGYPFLRLYMSKANGDQMYRVTDIPSTESSLIVGAGRRDVLLKTFNAVAPPAGTLIREFKSRLLIADGNKLHWTLPFYPWLTDQAKGHLTIRGTIRVVAPVEDGVYVVTDETTTFFMGLDPEDWIPKRVSTKGAVPHSSAMVPEHGFGSEEMAGQGYLWVWLDTEGALVAATSGGIVQRANAERMGATSFLAGASTYNEHDGMRQVVSVGRSKKSNTQGIATDWAVASVYSNDIDINDPDLGIPDMIVLSGTAINLGGDAIALHS